MDFRPVYTEYERNRGIHDRSNPVQVSLVYNTVAFTSSEETAVAFKFYADSVQAVHKRAFRKFYRRLRLSTASATTQIIICVGCLFAVGWTSVIWYLLEIRLFLLWSFLQILFLVQPASQHDIND